MRCSTVSLTTWDTQCREKQSCAAHRKHKEKPLHNSGSNQIILALSHPLYFNVFLLSYLFAFGFSSLEIVSNRYPKARPPVFSNFFLFEKLSFPVWHEIPCFCQAFVSLQGLCKTHRHWQEVGRHFKKVAAQLLAHPANAEWRLLPSFFFLKKKCKKGNRKAVGPWI